MRPSANSKAEALATNNPHYLAPNKCSLCELTNLRFTRNDRCMGCQRNKVYILSLMLAGREPVEQPGMGAYLLGTNDDGSPLFVSSDWIEELLPLRDAHAENGYVLAFSPCGKCGSPRIHHIGSPGCWACRNTPRELSPRQAAKAAGETWYTPTDPCKRCGQTALKRVVDGRCQGCHPPKRNPDSPRQAAMRAGETWYTPTDPCKHCGQTAPKRVNNGQCSGCVPAKRTTGKPSPKRQAILDGKKRYVPTDPCKHCGQRAERAVNYYRCYGCQPDVRHTQATEREDLSADAPDMIISRKDADALNLLTYRTGDYCKRGHNGWRYVSTGQCVDCMRTT